MCYVFTRQSYGGELLRQVRLPLMPASDIIDHVENTSCLMEVAECRLLVKEALHYHCLPARQSVLQVNFHNGNIRNYQFLDAHMSQIVAVLFRV